MLRERLGKIIQYSSVSVVEISLQPKGESVFHWLQLKHKGSSLSITDSASTITSEEDLLKHLKGSSAIAVLVTGKGVITRKTDARLTNAAKQLNAVLPNAKLDEFYLQTLAGHNTNFSSIARKSVVDPLLEKLSEAGIVVDLFIGNLVMASLQQIMAADGAMTLNDVTYAFENEQLSGWQKSEEISPSVVQVGDEKMESKLLTAFAVGLQHFFRPLQCSLQNHSFEGAAQELKQRQLFKVAGGLVLGLFFSVLLINYFVFEDYRKYYDALETEVSMNSQAIEQVENLRAELGDKQQLIASTGLMHQHSLAWYTDQIGQTVPDAIQLRSLDELPLEGKINKRRRPAFDQKSIVISGTTRESAELNNWIKILMEMDWTKGVEISHFSQPLNGLEGTFSIKLKL